MKLAHHIQVAGHAYESNNLRERGVLKAAFLFGSIAPDLNCVYPAHRLSTTEKRFMTRLLFVKKFRNTVLRSFVMGIITHYICDYFCFAHNHETLGLPHKKYETGLYQEFKRIQDRLPNERFNVTASHITDVHDYICDMFEKYSEEVGEELTDHWNTNRELMIRDIKYSWEICNRVVVALAA